MTDEACAKERENLVDDSWDYNSQQQVLPTENSQAQSQQPNDDEKPEDVVEEVKEEEKEEVKASESASGAAEAIVVD